MSKRDYFWSAIESVNASEEVVVTLIKRGLVCDIDMDMSGTGKVENSYGFLTC